MTIISSITDVSIKGDRRDAYGKYYQTGATMSGNIVVPMNRVDYIDLQDIASGIHSCSGVTKPYAITFPVNTAGSVVTNVLVVACMSGVSGIWWAFGKGA